MISSCTTLQRFPTSTMVTVRPCSSVVCQDSTQRVSSNQTPSEVWLLVNHAPINRVWAGENHPSLNALQVLFSVLPEAEVTPQPKHYWPCPGWNWRPPETDHQKNKKDRKGRPKNLLISQGCMVSKNWAKIASWFNVKNLIVAINKLNK